MQTHVWLGNDFCGPISAMLTPGLFNKRRCDNHLPINDLLYAEINAVMCAPAICCQLVALLTPVAYRRPTMARNRHFARPH